MIKGIQIKSDGSILSIDLADWEAIKAGIGGGYLQAVPFGETGAVLYCDEDGKNKGLPLNSIATVSSIKYQVGFSPDDYLVGDIILVGLPNQDGDDTSIPEELAKELLAFTS